MMRWTTIALCAWMMACGGAVADDPEEPPARLPEVPSPECDGSQTRHICGSIAATASRSVYGILPSCTTAPFLQTSSGVRVYREAGQVGCVDVSAPTARCCPR